MATTKANKVGRIRDRLADLLNEAIPTAQFEPEWLDSQIPYYATVQFDACSWYGDGTDKDTGLNAHVASWDTMRECVRYGIEVSESGRGRFDWDIYPKPPK